MMTQDHQSPEFYGKFGRFARWLLRTFSRRYTCLFSASDEPAVYVCRHLNMHGPYTTLKWIPFHVHPFSLHVFCDADAATAQLKDYTFSVRRGKKPMKHNPFAWLVGHTAARLLNSLQAIPTYRDVNAMKTIRGGLAYLLKGENLIVWPDIAYTEGYDKPCKIYSGFLLIGELYYRKTGKELSFIPLYIDDAHHTILAKDPIHISDYKTDIDKITVLLENALNQP